MNLVGVMRFIRFSLALLFVGAVSAKAGGGPQNVLVVVNDNSLESLELGQYYRERRAIPPANIFHIRTSTNYSLDTAGFTNEIRKPILDYIASSGLSNQIDYVVFSRGIPYRIYSGPYTNRRHCGLTAAMFYGFKSSPDAFVSGCELAPNSDSEYFNAERAFAHSDAPGGHLFYLSTILNGWTFPAAKCAIDRSVASDETSPTGTVFLARSSDNARNIQWYQYEDVDFDSRVLGSPQKCSMVDSDSMINQTNILGYMIGCTWVSYLDQNHFLPGALGNHLTSYGGYLLDPISSQMTILNWLNWGPVGSYGTVVEPCAYTNKFPAARLHYWYARGFNLAESFYMAVQNPYQGVVVGDPLCSPYAAKPNVLVSGLQSNSVVTSTVSIAITAEASSVARPVERIDVFIDNRFLRTLTCAPLAAGNVLYLSVDSVTCSYQVVSGDTLYSAAEGLANAVNSSNTTVRASARGDAILLVRTNFGAAGAATAYAASSGQGMAMVLTAWGYAAGPHLMESIYPAREFIALAGTPNPGDVVTCTVTLTNGVVVTNRVVAKAGQSCAHLLDQLMGVINSNAALQATNGVAALYHEQRGSPSREQASLQARCPGPEGYNIKVDYRVTRAVFGSGLDTHVTFTDNLNDNADVLTARGAVFLAQGLTNLTGAFDLTTTNLSDGPHVLTAVAYEGSAVRTQGRTTVPFIVENNEAVCMITNPVSGSTVLLGETVTAQGYASADAPVTAVTFYAEGKQVAVTGSAPFAFSLETTNYGVGRLDLQAEAVAANGDAVLSSIVTVTILPDYDFDGLDDDWEVRNFGSITHYTGADDPDADQASNRNEYMADTQPTNAASRFTVNCVDGADGVIRLEFVSSTARQYRIHYNNGSLMKGLWLDSSNWLWGGSGVTTQLDDGSVMPVPTNDHRFYRVRAHRP